jgi:hypothetical protein
MNNSRAQGYFDHRNNGNENFSRIWREISHHLIHKQITTEIKQVKR